MKRVIAIIVCVLTLVALCACGGGDGSVSGSQWTLSGVELGGIQVSGSENLAAYGLTGSIVFDGEDYVLTILGDEQTGTFTQKNDIITLNGSKTLFGVLDEEVLTIEDDAVGTLTFEKQ